MSVCTHMLTYFNKIQKINYGYKDNNDCRSYGAGNFHSM